MEAAERSGLVRRVRRCGEVLRRRVRRGVDGVRWRIAVRGAAGKGLPGAIVAPGTRRIFVRVWARGRELDVVR